VSATPAGARSPVRVTAADRLEAFVARALGRLSPRAMVRLSGRPPLAIDGQVLDPQLQLALAIRRRRGVPGLVEPTIEAGRRRYRRDMVVHRGPRTPVGAVRELAIPSPSADIPARYYAPPTTGDEVRRQAPLLVFLHGGGFVIGDLDTHDEACRILCRHGMLHVLAVDYRLAPEHPFPAALDDAWAAYAWARSHAARLGADPTCIAIGGDSAGGNLAAVTTQRARAEGVPMPAAQLLVYPATDGRDDARHPSQALFGDGLFLTNADRDAFTRAYIGGTDVTHDDPRVAPLRAHDLAGLPPALVVTAGFDLLRDEGEAYARALQNAGNHVQLLRYGAMAHGFINLTGVCRAARDATIEVAKVMRELLDIAPCHHD
jgi:acetyl esterase